LKLNVVVELVDEGTMGPLSEGESLVEPVSFRAGLGEFSEPPLIVASALFISSYDTAFCLTKKKPDRFNRFFYIPVYVLSINFNRLKRT
jgi:hypothetical protein